jgi:hypothetical protein
MSNGGKGCAGGEAYEGGEHPAAATSGPTGEAARSVKVRTGGRVRWTKELEGLFLDHLSATGNVTAAARAIGVSRHNVHYRHRTNAAFADAWDQALVAGYQTVEALMLEHLLNPDTFDWEKALRMMTQRAAYLKGSVRQGGPARTVATADETNAAILQKLAAIAAKGQREGKR